MTQGSDVAYAYPKQGSGPGATPWVLTGVLLGGGMVVALAGAFINPNPVHPDEARQMAIDYDVKLRRRLGLPDLRGTSRAPGRLPAISQISLTPAFGPTGGGLQLAFKF